MMKLRDKAAPWATEDEAHEAARGWIKRIAARVAGSPVGWVVLDDERGGFCFRLGFSYRQPGKRRERMGFAKCGQPKAGQ